LISTSQFKNGITIELDGTLFTIIDFQHVKPGKGGAFVRTKLRNVKTGAVIDRTFRAGEKVEQAILDRRQMQYLYNDSDHYYFMDTKTFDQLLLSIDQIGEATNYIKEGMLVDITTYENNPIGIELPISVELEVTQTDPGVKGDTATGGTKPATLETELVVQVPLFVQIGDILKIDTRTGTYITRV
jgi:elongation factor P